MTENVEGTAAATFAVFALMALTVTTALANVGRASPSALLLVALVGTMDVAEAVGIVPPL
jgi:hypothetical protein